MAVAQLPDGRAQLFAAGIDTGHVYTCWKHTVDTTSPWTSWQSFAGTDIVALAIAPSPMNASSSGDSTDTAPYSAPGN